MKRKTVNAVTLGVISAFVTTFSAQAGLVSGSASTWGVIQDDFQTGASATWSVGNNNADRLGAGGAGGNQRVNNPVWGFTLPSLPAGEQIDSVDFGFTMAAAAVNSSATFDAVISLMNYDVIGDFSAADYSSSVGSLGNGTLVATFNNTDVANSSVESFALTGAALTLFQSFYDASGNPLQSEVWFRASHDAGPWTYVSPNLSNDRYQFLDDGTGNITRTLDITTSVIPEPATLGLVAVFGSGIMFIRRRFTI